MQSFYHAGNVPPIPHRPLQGLPGVITFPYDKTSISIYLSAMHDPAITVLLPIACIHRFSKCVCPGSTPLSIWANPRIAHRSWLRPLSPSRQRIARLRRMQRYWVLTPERPTPHWSFLFRVLHGFCRLVTLLRMIRLGRISQNQCPFLNHGAG